MTYNILFGKDEMLDETRKYYIYVWRIKETQEVFYVGKGCGDRYKQVSRRNKFFLDMYNSHECECEILQGALTEQEAFKYEIILIKYYREYTNNRLTNVCDGGEGSSGFKHTEESKQKLSLANKLKWQDPTFREKEMQHRLYGVYQSQEFRDKISALVQGENNPNYGNHWSEEQKEHLSKLRKENGKSSGVNNPRATTIICLETGEIFNLIKDAMDKYNIINEGCFTVALNHPQRTTANLHWARFTEELTDERYRFNRLLNVLLQSRFSPYICVETHEIFNLQKDLMRQYNLSVKRFNRLKDNDGTLIIDNKTYMLISHYINSPYYQE